MPESIFFWSVLQGILLIAVITDLRSRIIPDWLILAGFTVLVAGHLIYHPGEILRYLLAATLYFAILLLVAAFSGGRLGGGDVKLFSLIAFGLGMHTTFYILVLSHVAAGLLVLVLLLFRRLRIGDTLPFVPFIFLGFLVVGAVRFVMETA